MIFCIIYNDDVIYYGRVYMEWLMAMVGWILKASIYKVDLGMLNTNGLRNGYLDTFIIRVGSTKWKLFKIHPKSSDHQQKCTDEPKHYDHLPKKTLVFHVPVKQFVFDQTQKLDYCHKFTYHHALYIYTYNTLFL